MHIRRPLVLIVAALAVLTQLGLSCDPLLPVINSPGTLVNTFGFTVEVEIPAIYNFNPATGVVINGEVVPVAGGPSIFSASVGAGGSLRDQNLLSVRATRINDAKLVTVTQGFDYLPPGKATAFQITDPGDLLTGPLAHNRVGDFMLRNTAARFVVQDGPERDLYSVGQYGGNLIDAAPVGVDGVENFLEFTTMVNVETVVNHDVVEVLNDGQNGAAAQVRACGPDDLLDFVNPSSVIEDAGLAVPPALDDNDQPIDVCTTYSLEPFDSHVRVDSVFMNSGGAPLANLVGDWFSGSGETERFFQPSMGVGPASFSTTLGALGFFGFDENAGVDYQYTTIPPASNPAATGSYVTISGVTVILHNQNVLLALLGVPSSYVIPAGGSNTATRFFGVGDGTSSHAVDLYNSVRGFAKADVDGCVTVNGAPAPGARVAIGTLNAGVIENLLNHFVTDAAGCYAGTVAVSAATNLGVAAALKGHLYTGGTPAPPVTNVAVTPGGSHTVPTIDLPQAGTLKVVATDETASPVPVRVTVVGFDASPEPVIPGPALPVPGFGSSDLGLFQDIDDQIPFGLVTFAYTGADGEVEFDLEPQGTDANRGIYHVYVSRGTEYSLWRTPAPVTITAGMQTLVNAQIARVLDTDGYVSSDYHVHGIASTDSRVSDLKRVESFAGEGVDNIIMTDHHAHTDLDPKIAAEGLSGWVTSTVGEEITTFDYGHFNGYPFTVDPNLASGGSTDWAVAAPVGQDFPSLGALNSTPQEIHDLARVGSPNTIAGVTTIQINHIGSHFSPLKIDTSLVPPADGLTDAERAGRRLPDTTAVPNLFAHFPALELWNGSSRGAQNSFLDERIGIWMNHLNQGLKTTFIADTDTHTFSNLETAGARTWTAASSTTDTPATFSETELAQAVDDGKAVGGQGVFVTARLLATDGSGDVADLTATGDTTMTDVAGNVDLEISIQAPIWAEYDTIEIYANAATVPNDPLAPYAYDATPTVVLTPPTFSVNTVVVDGAIPGASRLETVHTESFLGLTADTWFVVVVKGTDGVSRPMFPVYPRNMQTGTNATLADLVDGNLGETGTLALGATNALYFEAP